MLAYDFDDTVGLDGPDAFGASRAAFAALARTLGGHEAADWTHDQLEDHLQAHGRELLRLLLQDHLDLRAVREQQAARRPARPSTAKASATPRASPTGRWRPATSATWPRSMARCG
jgi:hypothetical protein